MPIPPKTPKILRSSGETSLSSLRSLSRKKEEGCTFNNPPRQGMAPIPSGGFSFTSTLTLGITGRVVSSSINKDGGFTRRMRPISNRFWADEFPVGDNALDHSYSVGQSPAPRNPSESYLSCALGRSLDIPFVFHASQDPPGMGDPQAPGIRRTRAETRQNSPLRGIPGHEGDSGLRSKVLRPGGFNRA